MPEPNLMSFFVPERSFLHPKNIGKIIPESFKKSAVRFLGTGSSDGYGSRPRVNNVASQQKPSVASQQKPTPVFRSNTGNVSTGNPHEDFRNITNEYFESVPGLPDAYSQGRFFHSTTNRQGEPLTPPEPINFPPLPKKSTLPPVDPNVEGYRRARRYFGPTRPTGHDFGNAMHRMIGMNQIQNFMNAPQKMADDMNAHFNRAADRSLMNAPNITNRMAIASRERQNNRLMDVIANVLGGGGAAANPLPQDAIDSAQRSLAFSSAPRNNPVPVSPEAQREINQILSGNIAMRAPDVERTLNPANAALGRAIEQQRLASLQPFARMMV